ncbi:Dipeptidyl-peptidase 5 [Stygiomarasmius scandens]|uniref:Dipeptidyl-peptidase V n=1 Tax=Marasmiellus scandens TaxID=2682957 RepID=A0ABR1KAD7_9AGAR
MRIPFAWLGFGAQIPLQGLPTTDRAILDGPHKHNDFRFKEGANVFTPKDAIELGRPGVGVANEAGDLALVPYSQFSFDDEIDHKSLFVVGLDLNTTRPPLFQLSVNKAFWINNRTFGHVVDAENDEGLKINTVTIGIIAGNLHLTESVDNVYADGNLSAVPEYDRAWESRGNSALVYDATPARFWDTWMGPKAASLFSVGMQLDVLSKRWNIGSDFVNLLGKHRLSPTALAEGYAGTWDASAKSVVYIVPENTPGKAFHLKQDVYVVDAAGGSKPRLLTSGEQGDTHGPVVSGDGTKIAWIQRVDAYDAGRQTSFISEWDRSAETLTFSKDGKFLYFIAGDHARNKVFTIPISNGTSSKPTTPVKLTRSDSVSGLQPLPDGRLLLTKSSYTSPNDLFLLRGFDALEANPDTKAFVAREERVTHFTESALSRKKLSPAEAFWFKGADDVDVQGWVVKPPGWKKEQRKKWPVALLIHGGPQSAWLDSWSTRWNPNVFAQQGYFCVLINPTGSTTFGQNFTDAIDRDWGGKPFVDLQKGWKHVLKEYPQVDPKRAIGAGGSWGGYAINWIQGHPEYEFGFKAVFAHDGVFNALYDQYSVDIPFFFEKAWGGEPWNETAKEIALKNSPSTFVHKWHIPELIVHGSKDYRLPETEGIAPFHALQQ